MTAQHVVYALHVLSLKHVVYFLHVLFRLRFPFLLYVAVYNVVLRLKKQVKVLQLLIVVFAMLNIYVFITHLIDTTAFGF